MASKEENTSFIENKLAKVEINDNLEKKFLHDLELKLSVTSGDCIVSCMIREKSRGSLFETFPMKPETAQKLLKVVDDHISEQFFSSNGLAELG